MEISENDATSSPVATNSRRKSGRAVRAPEKFVPDLPSSQPEKSSAKRKRGHEDVQNDASEAEEDEEDESDQESEESTAEEEVRPTRKKAKAPRKPTAKKAKTNGASQPADEEDAEADEDDAATARLPSRPKKGKKVAIADQNAEGLYAEVYTSGRSLNDVVAEWLIAYNEDNAAALTDLVNFVIKSTGCDNQVTEDDINDPENIEQRIGELQEEFQATNPSEYPLGSKAKSSYAFRSCLVQFFDSLVESIHKSGLMYDEVALLENLHLWVVTMSSSAVRAFRHTATLVALTMTSAMCKASQELTEMNAKTLRQLESEKAKGKRANKGRLAEFQANVEYGEKNAGLLETTIKDFFDTVFVHRYRDVDPKIRTDCVEALGNWITEMPSIFFDGSYLRYLGWMLSDVTHNTRHAVVKQLTKVMKNKNNIGGMRHFIERFRSRLVEIATRDAESSVRTSGIELIDMVRDAGMLEPDDIDMIGKLIFDADPKVRKAVVPFFLESIKDIYDSKVEDSGGEDGLEEVLTTDEDDFDSPQAGWIKLKSLAEILSSYDALDSEEFPSQMVQGSSRSNLRESRFTCAAQALYGNMPELKEWEVLAGYLLYDHSARPKGSEVERAFKQAVKPEEFEEFILLDILNAVVKLNLTTDLDLDKSKDKSKRAAKAELVESKEATARHLAETIPKLLKKFGASPRTATVVLRLEHTLNLDVFQELRQDSTAYAKLLDEISAQFTKHADKGVIDEAGAALLRARGYEDLEEVTEGKMQLLWEDTAETLRRIDQAGEISIRGSLGVSVLEELCNNLARLEKLSSISNPIEALDQSTGDVDSPPINILLQIVARGEFKEPDEDIDLLEDRATSSAIQSSLFYFMWQTKILLESMESGADISEEDIDMLKERKNVFIANLVRTFSSRASIDPVRLLATGAYLDLHTLFASLSRNKSSAQQSTTSEKLYTNLEEELLAEIDYDVQVEITSIFDACEKQYAKRAKRKLAEAGEDEDPEDPESEPEDDEEENEDITDHERHAEILQAEQQLCEITSKIILAILASVIDVSDESKGKLRKRMQRNRFALGPNFKEVVAYLDEPKAKTKKSHKSKAQQAAAAKKNEAAKKSDEKIQQDGDEEVVEEDEDEQEEDEDDPFAELEEPEEGAEEDVQSLDPDGGDESAAAHGGEDEVMGD
ncbi:hypothetical protein BP5796_00705 [Coleophoma crateriformis]|uniref:SCD domain-containing protein n=1 Tax=Coleophoma crateriformis TaxID=565419 RepID=A0A3D8T8M5_9HELO|nr:hypothetical protein BP5796_00705 [Coleophoma crateriformis]